MENIIREMSEHSAVCPAGLVLYDRTDSTNERARRLDTAGAAFKITYPNGVKDSCLFVADMQSAGRGRLGRVFESPACAGLYMSLRVRIGRPLAELNYVTPLAAVCAARAIESLCGADIKIKWVNDLYLGGKKLAGILTEVVPTECSEGHSTLVIGIGINLKRSALSPEVLRVATSLEAEGFSVDRARLTALLASKLLSELESPDLSDILAEYRRRSFLIGETVTVSTPLESYSATVTGIGDSFELTVDREGESIALISADVTRLGLTP